MTGEAVDVTDLVGTDELEEHMNEKVIIRGLTVAPQADGAAFAYKNPANKTDDLYVSFTLGDEEMDFLVEFYLRNNETDVYQAVEGLEVGDVVDIEGYLYWYYGPNVHLTVVTKVE